MGDVGDVMHDDPFDGEEEGGEAGVTGGSGLAENGDAGDEEDEEKEENGADEEDAEDELARRQATTATGRRGGGLRKGGRDHWDEMVTRMVSRPL